MRSAEAAHRSRRASLAAVALCGLSILLSGCAGYGVQPWEHDILARRSMQLNTHPNIAAADDHIYFSKEGSAGGRSFDGGGCGCN